MKRLITAGLAAAIATGTPFTYAANPAQANNRATITKESTSFRDVVKKVLPAVVSIEPVQKAKTTTAKRPQKQPSPFEGFQGLPDELRKQFERMPQFNNPEEQPRGRSMGSGFVVDASGVILTNDHVVRGADEVEVTFQDGRKLKSRDIKRDGKTDLAVVRVETKEPLPFLKFGDSDELEVGDRVLAFGAPLGMTGSVTSGIISAKGRDIHMNMYEDFIQTDAAINPGNSGGPLVNVAGEVIGINSAIKSGTGGFQGIGLAISTKLAKNVMDQLTAAGTVHRGYLGVQVGMLDPEVANRFGLNGKTGVVIGKVTPNSPAAKCGLTDGDILTTVAGQAIKDPRQLQQIVAALPIGKTAEVRYTRDGEHKVGTLTVEEQPEVTQVSADLPEAQATLLDKVGIRISDLTKEQAKELGFAGKAQGALVSDVEPDSIAANAGLQNGTLILSVDRQTVTTAKEAQTAIEKGSLEKGILLQVRTPQGGTTYTMLKASPNT